MTAKEGNGTTDVVEMDAIDIEEWDRDRHTPRAHDTNLAELVRQSAAVEPAPEPVIKSLLKTATAHTTRSPRAPSTTARPPTLDDAWEEPKPAVAPAVPRTKTSPNTMRRTGPVPVQKIPPALQPVAKPPVVGAKPPVPKAVVTKPVEPPKPVVITPKPIVAAAPEPPVRASEPEMLPPPPAIPPGDFDASPSVVIDLGANSAPISASPPVVAPASSVWDRPSIAAAPTVVARHTPTPAALEASVPQPVAHVETDRRVVPRSILATVFPTPRTRRTAIIACASVAVLVIILVVAFGGHRATETTTEKRVAIATPPVKTGATHATTPAPEHVVAVAPVAPRPPIETPPAPPPRKAPARRIVPRKPVVVDYDKKPVPTAAEQQDQSLAHARAAYATGNQHLFAGDAIAAIASYRQAITIYPNYAAGYRGLGLAYTQQGDNVAALRAFKTYVKLAPAAKDVALITKRIARLSAR